MKNQNHCRRFAALWHVLLTMLTTAQAASAGQIADAVEGTYWTDIGKLGVPIQTFKIVSKDNKLIGYERWSQATWEEIPARQLQDLELKKLLAALVFVTALTSPAAFAAMGGIDHLADYRSVSDFSVNGAEGFQTCQGWPGTPGSSLPDKWHPGLTVRVKWTVSDWKHGGGGHYEDYGPG